MYIYYLGSLVEVASYKAQRIVVHCWIISRLATSWTAGIRFAGRGRGVSFRHLVCRSECVAPTQRTVSETDHHIAPKLGLRGASLAVSRMSS
jgi:hypothetical protein